METTLPMGGNNASNGRKQAPENAENLHPDGAEVPVVCLE